MAIDNEGRLLTAVSDSCNNYDPDKLKRTGISAQTGVIYECRNHQIADEKFPDIVGSNPNACLFCYNWQTPQGEYKNRE